MYVCFAFLLVALGRISVQTFGDIVEVGFPVAIKRERFYGKTVRKFYVGDVDSEKINAEYKDGMLELVVPKEEKLPNKKSIEIK